MLVADEAEHVFRLRLAFIEAATVLLHECFSITRGDHPCGHQLVGEKLPRGRLAADRCVHDWLRRRGLVGLVVPEPAIADEIDDDVLVELHAVVDGETRREYHRFGVVAVHVQDRRLDHLRDVAAIERRARVTRVVRW